MTFLLALLSRLRHRRQPGLLLLGFGLIYGLISLVNQLNFRTAALDLGITAQVVAAFAHGRAPWATLLHDAPPMPFLAIHFSLTPVLAVPLYWLVGGAWALLLVQLGAVLLGALGVWRYALARGATPGQAGWALALFGSQWGVFSALGFDYHDNVVGAMVLPWLALWVGQRRWLPAAAAALLLLLSKENMALWLAFVLLGLAWQHRRQRAVAAGLGLAAGGALVYFWVITNYVMPGLDHAHRAFAQLVRYRHLGPSLPAAVAYVLAHPAALWAALLENTTGDPAHNYIKLELWAALLLSGGWALLRRPWYALMLLPIVGQKLLANDPGIWGINGQYSIEFAPVLALAVADWLAARPPLPAGRRWGLAGPAAVAVTALFTIVTLYTRQSTWYDRTTTNFLLGRHYRCSYQRAALHAALARLPATAALSAQSCLVPQVPERPQLYLFPVVRDARYVAILRHPDEGSAWPLSLAASARAVEQLRARADFRVAYEDEQLLIFKRFGPVANAAEVLQP